MGCTLVHSGLLIVVSVAACACEHRERPQVLSEARPVKAPIQASTPAETNDPEKLHASSPIPSPLPPRPVEASDAALVKGRPYALIVPTERQGKGSEPLPLFVYLHGYGSSAKRLDEVLEVGDLAREKGVLLAIPDGTRSLKGRRFWNATPACCNFTGSTVDDVAYIAALIDDVKRRETVDERRVFIVGHSNGGFMAHRLACELSDRVVGIASIAGATFPDIERCQPKAPVTVLQIHGDADQIISFSGGHALGKASLPRHPSAHETVASWAKLNGCESTLRSVDTIDLEDRYQGQETSVGEYRGCQGGAAVELWAVGGGGHFVGQGRRALEALHEFLLSHPRAPR